ncbi:3-phosphoshikimate 1-carboxyvinyltransferase [Metallosphaera sp. J1]|uniref:3-phosphoshikimate 1-carboxyvinyltransferase n=1 Tax=Metallosphaera TaxID=41980 RepID=UPI0029FF3F5A|nr:3-phosphoshikimate 1-carboxyvinyltransferase [Metallosphaera javensis (ex Hofmann et al. 2022)]MCG3109739.1 3-phosphoshikimate 1-carboxyvinyltransferase [Metallosphaera javensis (ex Hofmann et al. 2022)]BCS91557.1 MAG: 3-phosphoshikimate 1-carboxyvinyltransferase [Metallosphaera javensis (ex Sakai et al. 2022)]
MVEIEPSRIEGRVNAPPSKSLGIRYVFLSLLTDVSLRGLPESDDVKVAVNVVNALKQGKEELYLGGSATTLRMIIPVILALGRRVRLDGDETLRRRPLSALKSLPGHFSAFNLPLTVEGKLGPETEVEGWESSQYVSGLIYAYCLLGQGRIRVIPPVSSRGYIYMTADVISSVGGRVTIQGEEIAVECRNLRRFEGNVPGDYALASFYAIGAVLTGGEVEIANLYPPPSYVGDHQIVNMIEETGAESRVTGDRWIVKDTGRRIPISVSINDVPDLAPSLAALMAVVPGKSEILEAERLRIKESDRVSTILSTLSSFGVSGSYSSGTITIVGGEPRRGEVECPKDHRIAMMAGDLALRAGGRIRSAECVNKSNPRYWDDLLGLGSRLKIKA